MTLPGHQPAAPESPTAVLERLHSFEMALWELIIQLPPTVRRELLDRGCDLAALVRARLATAGAPKPPTPHS